MKYAVKYNSNFRYLKEIDEVIFNYKGTEQIVEFIPSKLKDTQKAIINLSGAGSAEDILPYLNKLKTIHNNFMVQINFYHPYRDELIDILNDNEIGFMFENPAVDYETFYTMVMLGAEDVYVAENLGFYLKDLQFARDYYGVRIRVFPDIVQWTQGCIEVTHPAANFFIRPEDTELYEKYVDVFEFYTVEKASVKYEVYKKQQWLGDLKDLIGDLRIDTFPNTGIAPHFGQQRINCHKKCMFERCYICPEIHKLSKSFNAANVEIIKKKKKPEITEEQKKEVYETLKKIQEEKE